MNLENTTPDEALGSFCLAINQVRALGFVIENSNKDIDMERPFDDYSVEDVYTIGSMLIDAAEDLKQLLDLAEKHQIRQKKEITWLKARIMDLESKGGKL
jgi:hypothetical protein